MIFQVITYLLVLVLAVLLLIYAAPRRYQVKVTRTVPASPERVWTYVSEPERFPHWFPYVVSCVHAGGPARGLGQLRRLALDRDGKLGEREEEATMWEENRLLVLTHRREEHRGQTVLWSDARSEFRLAPAAEGTAVTGVLWFSGRGATGRVFSLLSLRKRHESDFRTALANLEKRLREDTYPA